MPSPKATLYYTATAHIFALLIYDSHDISAVLYYSIYKPSSSGFGIGREEFWFLVWMITLFLGKRIISIS
jgi:hypothetical protein